MGAVSVATRHPRPRGSRGVSDQRLVARVASGDDHAFEEILDRYGPALLSFCVHMLGSREWGEDALQLTLVAAYKALRRGGCDGALRPWLYAIARNRCLSELRARREVPDSDWVSVDRPAIDGPASLFARREQLREIVEDIQRLPVDQRAALVLFELGDQSHEEIATVLGVRRDKVKALIFQAREGLCRARSARDIACVEVHEQLANARGKAPARGVVRAHIDRCAPCQAFAREVRRQRAALALVLPVVLTGRLRALLLSAAVGHGSAGGGAATVTGAGGAGSLSAATAGSASSGAVAAPGSLAGAAASAGSASSAVGGGAVSAAAGTATPTMVASALSTDAVAGVGALTSSVSVATVAKLATVVAVTVGVGGLTRSVLAPSPRPQGSFLAGQPQPAVRLRSPLQSLVSGIADPLISPTKPGSRPGAGAAAAAAGAPPGSTASGPASSSSPAPSSSANPSGSGPSAPGTGAPAPTTGTSSAPAGSAPGDGSATTTAPSSASSTTTTATTTPTASSPTTSTGPSSGSSASRGTSGASPGVAGNGAGDPTGHGRTSQGDPGNGVTHSNGNGPPIIPPGCVNNPAPGCAKKTPRS